MYPATEGLLQKQNADVNFRYGSDNLNASQPPQPPGIASRMEELRKEVQDLLTRSCEVQAALGISQPDQAGKSPSVSSLAEVLTDLRIKVSAANFNLMQVLQHINS